MSDELKPCPFCGGEADIEETSFMEHATFSVGCRSMEGPDECIGQQSLLTFARKSEAIAAWNRRASPIPEGGEEAREAAQRIVDWADNGKLADDEWLVERNETAIIAICRALLSSPRVEDVRREALEEAAKVAIDHASRRRRLAMEFITNPPLYSEQETARTAALTIAADIRALSPPVG